MDAAVRSVVFWSLGFIWIPGSMAQDTAEVRIPRIWDDQALNDWATPIAALGLRPGHFRSDEYYSVPADNLKTYPVYHPNREPRGYWEWLQKQKPQPLVDASKLGTHADWVKAGEIAFQTLGDRGTSDAETINSYRDPSAWEKVWTQPDGSLLGDRWVVTKNGIELRRAACAGCHTRVRADGLNLWGVPEGDPPEGYRKGVVLHRSSQQNSSRALRAWQSFTVPWAPDERIEQLRDPGAADAILKLIDQSTVWGVLARPHASPYYITKIPDLNPLRFSRYIDATATHRLRGPEDVARYAAFITGTDPMEFGSHKILKPEQRRITIRYADEVLYAIGVYLMSLEPPKNPDVAPEALINRGREVFSRETCVQCHVPPNYTSGKLTLAQGFTPPGGHPNAADIINRSVGTDPGLAMKTRKGTGLYKIPSLRGVWYRPFLLHDGSLASLEEMFDPDRLKPDHVPGGWQGPGVAKRAVPGHPFGLALDSADKKALLAFLRSL